MSFRHVQVAFAGHRATILGDTDAAASALAEVFDLLKEAGVESAKLLTGLAEGADVLAAREWSEAGLGPVHAVYSFLDDAPPEATASRVDSAVWLDGASLEAAGRSAFLAQTRWLIASADILVVIWDGGRGRGSGGTADAVRLALEFDLSVLWIDPADYTSARLIHPPDRDQGFGFIEVQERLERDPAFAPRATAEALHNTLAARGFYEEWQTSGEEVPAHRPFAQWLDRLLFATVWRSYRIFRNALGGKVSHGEPVGPPPEDLKSAPGFARLTEAYERADAAANRLATVHRSQQILLLCAAIVASIVGSSPAVWPQIKIYAVLGELGLALLALLVWSGAARANRHERWSEARRVAEQLRLERAAWPLGLSSVDSRERDSLGPAARVARDLRRRVGPPAGPFDADRVARWGGWAIAELVGSQAAYHHTEGHRNERIAHRIHVAENASFGVLVFVLVAFAITYAIVHMMGLELVRWVGGVVIMTGAIAPAIGAASLALEATLAFGEQSRRSLYLGDRLEAIEESVADPPRLDDLQRAARSAIRLQHSQEDRWWEAATRRRLFRGG